MADIFGRIDQQFAGGLSSDTMFMTFPGLPGGGFGLIIQDIAVQYAQPVRRLFEIGPGFAAVSNSKLFANGSNCDVPGTISGGPSVDCNNRAQATYYVAGRPEGTLQIGRIFGPVLIGQQFYKTYGNPCNPNNNLRLSGKAGCNGTTTTPTQFWDLSGVVLTTVAMNVNAQDMLIQERVGAMFIELKLSDNQGQQALVANVGNAVAGAVGAAAGAIGAAVQGAFNLLNQPQNNNQPGGGGGVQAPTPIAALSAQSQQQIEDLFSAQGFDLAALDPNGDLFEVVVAAVNGLINVTTTVAAAITLILSLVGDLILAGVAAGDTGAEILANIIATLNAIAA